MLKRKSDIIKFQIVFIILLGLVGCNTTQKKEKIEKKPPNIILFLVDDLGWQDTSVPFWTDTTENNRIYQTPNIERLVQKGMKFTQAYAHSICSPSRVSLLTGMNPARHRVTNWTLEKDKKRGAELTHDSLIFPNWNVNGISTQKEVANTVYARTLPEILSDNGYRTIHSGKAHFGAIGVPSENPVNIGFDVNIAGHAAGAPASYYGKENFGAEKSEVWGVPGLEKYHEKDIFLTEVLTIEAISAMEQSIVDESPFFLNMSHYAVHTPIEGDPRFLDKYLELGMDPIEANYASMIEGVDKSLGDMMQFLEEKQILDNTVILFMSDNGGLTNTPPRGGVAFEHNYPLSSGKSSAREGGIRVPMIASWSEHIKMDVTNNTPIIIEDFFPTILSIAVGEESKTPQVVDGKSFLPQLRDSHAHSNPQRAFIWHYPNDNGIPEGPGFGPYSFIRKGDWKLIYYHADSSFELFNLENDLGETNNVFDSEPQIAKDLATQLTTYLKRVDAQMPSYKKNGKRVDLPLVAINKINNH